MRSPDVAARLQREMDEVHEFWEQCQERRSEKPHPTDDDEMGLIYAALLMAVPEGLERLRKAWVLDRLEMEESTVESVFPS